MKLAVALRIVPLAIIGISGGAIGIIGSYSWLAISIGLLVVIVNSVAFGFIIATEWEK